MSRGALQLQCKSVRDARARTDGHRVLADRLWPRGVSREAAGLDDWAKELAPSAELRKWFGHDPERFFRFRQRYISELRERRPELAKLRGRSRAGRVTLLYAAADHEHNNAIVLAEVLKRGLPSK